MPKPRRKPIGRVAAALACMATFGSAQAAETGFSIYPLGGMAFGAGVTPQYGATKRFEGTTSLVAATVRF